MKVRLISVGEKKTLHPLNIKRRISEFRIAGHRYSDILRSRLENFNCDSICVREDFFPSDELLAKIAKLKSFMVVCPMEGLPLCWTSRGDSDNPDSMAEEIKCDESCRVIRYPWDILFINEKIVSEMKEDSILCPMPEAIGIDGRLRVAKTAKILPGAYFEGNVVIGENCKIGPNCYIRGNTYIGDGSHIGNAVEIKNSVLMEKVSVAHLAAYRVPCAEDTADKTEYKSGRQSGVADKLVLISEDE